MKFSWKGQLIDIPSTSGGTSTASAEDYTTVRVSEIVSNNWTIRKYEDGYLEMSLSKSISVNMDTKVGDRLFVSSTTFDDAYPITLARVYNCIVSIAATNFTCFPVCANSDNALVRTTKWRGLGYASSATSPSVTVRYYVTGRWK